MTANRHVHVELNELNGLNVANMVFLSCRYYNMSVKKYYCFTANYSIKKGTYDM